jgi:hypothetical protein
MPSPFPGMDPYLEGDDLSWGLQHGLISQLQAALNRQLVPMYVARIETRVYTPDDYLRLMEHELTEAYITIQVPKKAERIAVIEVLRPTNKVANSRGIKSLLDHRRDAMAAGLHWVEIDLLRNGERVPTVPAAGVASDYLVTVAPSDRRSPRAWAIGVREVLPAIAIPLKADEPDVTVDLGALLNVQYDVACYDCLVDYTKPPPCRLNRIDARWANRLLRDKGLR